EAADRRAGGAQTAVQLEGEEQGRQLRLRVGAPAAVAELALKVVEVDATHPVKGAADRDDPRVVLAPRHPAEQQSGQREVPEVVGPERYLEAVRSLSPGRERHGAGVVDEQVEGFVLPFEPLSKPTHGGEASEVERADLDLGVRHGRLDGSARSGAILGVADGEDDSGAGPGE